MPYCYFALYYFVSWLQKQYKFIFMGKYKDIENNKENLNYSQYFTYKH
jgi:hypothetical protein